MKLAVWMSVVCLLWGAEAPASCSIRATMGLNFGAYDPFSTVSVQTAGSVTIFCTVLQLGTVTVDLSPGSSGSYAARRMSTAGDTLTYNLYLNPERTLVFGDGSSGTGHFGPLILPILGVNRTIDIYGLIPAGQNVKAGSYSDTVVITLSY